MVFSIFQYTRKFLYMHANYARICIVNEGFYFNLKKGESASEVFLTRVHC
jgi:hypothetical protein